MKPTATGPQTGSALHRAPINHLRPQTSAYSMHRDRHTAPVVPPEFRNVDRMVRALQARATHGISPAAIAEAWMDWAVHLMIAPGKQSELAVRAAVTLTRFALWLPDAALGVHRDTRAEPQRGDRRFAEPAWSVFPFNAVAEAHRVWEARWLDAVRRVPGLIQHHEPEVAFMMRQLIDMFAPTNVPWLNPVILQRTFREGGGNLARGVANWLEDLDHELSGKAPVGAESFVAGAMLPSRPATWCSATT